MKITFSENEFNSWFELFPETTAEVAMLFRMANNTKAEAPEINLWMSGEPSCSVVFKKVDKKVQRNYFKKQSRD